MDLSLIAIFSSFLISVLFSLLYLPHLLRARSPVPRRLPGSNGLPFVGEGLAMRSLGKKGAPERFVLDRIKKYSSKTFRTSLIGYPVAVFCGAEGNKFVFATENHKLVQSWVPPSVHLLLRSVTNTACADMDDKKTKVRKFIATFMKPHGLQVLISVVDSSTKQHLEKHWEGKDIVTVFPSVKDLVFRLGCLLFMGVDDEDTPEKLRKPFGELVRAILCLPVNLPGTTFNRGIKALATLQKEVDVLIKRWKSDYSEGKMSASQAMLYKLLLEAFQGDEEDVFLTIITLINGSFDNVSSAIASVTMFLAEYPHAYDKVLAEQREVAQSKGAGEALKWEDIQKMKYSWNMVCEVFRMHPPSSGNFREAVKDFEYNGFLIPKGLKIHWNTYGTHRNPEYFKDPNKFDPSRFEGDGPMPYSFVPFGGGTLMCPGREYARVSILVYMHHLVTKFKLEKVFPDEIIIHDSVPIPAKGLPIRLYPHASIPNAAQ